MATTRRRKPQVQQSSSSTLPASSPASQQSSPSKTETRSQIGADKAAMNKTLGGQPVWVVLALSSGACAAINGVFAKLTTTSLTSDLSAHIAKLLGLSADNNPVNVLLRASFFGLNLLFNGIMWGLFTAALTKGSSTTRVSIVNVSANFFLTAILGWLIFSEKLPFQWWMGAVLLACGNVVIGMREEDGDKKDHGIALESDAGEDLLTRSNDDEAGDLLELDETVERDRADEAQRMRRGDDIDAPI